MTTPDGPHPAAPTTPSPPAPSPPARPRGHWFDVVAVGTLAGSLAGLAGGWHWLLDLTTHFRWYWFVLSIAGLVASLRWRRPTAVACLAIAAAVNARDLLPYWLPRARPATARSIDQARRIRVIAMNVHRVNDDATAATAYLRTRRPDVVAVLEVDGAWAAALEQLADLFPHRLIRPRDDNFGIAVLSRVPLADVEERVFCATGYPSILATVRLDGGDLRLIATHPYPPFDAACSSLLTEHLDGVAAAAVASPIPCLVAGDLNATPWSRPFRRLVSASGLVDSALGRGIAPTWHAHLPAPRIPIDHVLVPADAIVLHREVGPDIGSDHLPVEVDVALP